MKTYSDMTPARANLKWLKLMARTAEAAKPAFIFLFVYTASAKLFDFTAFRNVLSLSPLIADHAYLLAWVLPWAELIAAGLLLFKRTAKPGMYACLALMTLFSAYIAYMLLFQKNLPCSCGGVLRTMSWPQHLVFNLFFIFLALCNILFLDDKRFRERSYIIK